MIISKIQRVNRVALFAFILVIGAATATATASAQAKKHKVSPNQATAIALKKFNGKAVGTAKLEHEDGKWQYEVIVKVGKKMKELNVDAESGKITSVENTSAAEEAKEAKKSKKG